MSDLSTTTSRVMAIRDPEEVCSERVIEEAEKSRAFHRRLRRKINSTCEMQALPDVAEPVGSG